MSTNSSGIAAKRPWINLSYWWATQHNVGRAAYAIHRIGPTVLYHAGTGAIVRGVPSGALEGGVVSNAVGT